MTATDSPGHRGSFPTTRWSLVLHAGADAALPAHAALEKLCRQYWYPLYGFVRRQGRTHHEAEDCTQAFLARLLAADGIARARREQGRFRTFLLTALRHFLIDEWRRTRAARRGGGQATLPLDLVDAAGRFAREPADPGLSPEQAFDRNWGLGLIHQEVAGLRVEYERDGQGAVFAALQPHLWGASPPDNQAATAAKLRMSPGAFTVALQRARQRLRARVRLHVTETVADKADVDAELRHLIAAVGSLTSAG